MSERTGPQSSKKLNLCNCSEHQRWENRRHTDYRKMMRYQTTGRMPPWLTVRTHAEVAKLLGISRARVQAIERVALNKLRILLERDG